LAGARDIAAALQRYEAMRKPRTNFVQNLSRRNARVFHLRGAAGFMRNQIAPWAGQRAMDRLYAYDAFTPSGD
jgi:salicylate hydroxylase